jgi:hypothetical protein
MAKPVIICDSEWKVEAAPVGNICVRTPVTVPSLTKIKKVPQLLSFACLSLRSERRH